MPDGASRAGISAVTRSSFRLLAVITFNRRGFATIASCPMALSKRLIQSECVPTSSAMRRRFSWPYNCVIAAFVVPTLPSLTFSPLLSRMK